MKIDYRREIKHNYLIIDPEELFWQGYESQMLSRNQIEGILRFQIRQTDEGARFYYEITSRQPLSRILGNRNIQAEEIRKLVIGIFNILERMESYLLGEGNILLNPEYLYVEPDSFRVWLCLVPGLKKNFPEDFSKLLEYLLGCVDHQDRDSVVLAYGLYQETRKENYGLEDIMRLLQQEKTNQNAAFEKTEYSNCKNQSEFEQNQPNAENINKEKEWDSRRRDQCRVREKRGNGIQNLRSDQNSRNSRDFKNNYKETKQKNEKKDAYKKNEENNQNKKNIRKKQNDYGDDKEECGWKNRWHQWKKRIFPWLTRKKRNYRYECHGR